MRKIVTLIVLAIAANAMAATVWPDEASFLGQIQGGYYLDVEKNGEGCGYRTDAHENWYHDYSTGFRCCADAK